MIRDMVAGLAARLEEQPDDLEGWRMLGRSYQVLGEPQQAADAYRHVAEALPDDLAAQLDYADALLAAAPDGQVPAGRAGADAPRARARPAEPCAPCSISARPRRRRAMPPPRARTGSACSPRCRRTRPSGRRSSGCSTSCRLAPEPERLSSTRRPAPGWSGAGADFVIGYCHSYSL